MSLLAADPNEYAGWGVLGTLIVTLITFVVTMRRDGKAGEAGAVAPYKAGLDAAIMELTRVREENATMHRDRETILQTIATLRAENRHLRAQIKKHPSPEGDSDVRE